MNYDGDIDLRFFARDFIRTHGGAVEDQGPAMDAVLPEELADELSVSEYLKLQFGTEGEGEGKIHYGSPLLEKMVTVARDRVPVIICKLCFDYLKTAGFDRLIQERFHFRNGVGKVEKTAPTLSDYILLHCSYLAQSDEQKEGLLTLVYNRDTFVEVSTMADGLAGVEMDFADEATPVGLSEKEIKRIEKLVQNSAETALAVALKDFEASMNRRYRRDVKNLNEYYSALQLEMEKNLKRSGLSERLISDRKEKIELIPAELASKTDDLFKKYSIRIKLKLGGAMIVKSPVVKIFFKVAVGRKKKTITLQYNPVMKSIEPLQCRQCSNDTFKPFFGENMKILCPQCG
jgi:Zn finger protein HypA/HybF involved in hydrogenase expression